MLYSCTHMHQWASKGQLSTRRERKALRALAYVALRCVLNSVHRPYCEPPLHYYVSHRVDAPQLAYTPATEHVLTTRRYIQMSPVLDASCRYGTDIAYLSEMCRPSSSEAGRRHLRSANRGQLVVPATG